MFATIKGYHQIVKYVLQDPFININDTCSITGANSFWMASYYNRGQCLSLLG